ncbi:unnamed protein product [Orchesella dallaii]|uniref:Uncharacterized protein n=1 Tax=Orchesella dallaii TaxID=48710 RepID=A0ABP1R7T6_9HEXA
MVVKFMKTSESNKVARIRPSLHQEVLGAINLHNPKCTLKLRDLHLKYEDTKTLTETGTNDDSQLVFPVQNNPRTTQESPTPQNQLRRIQPLNNPPSPNFFNHRPLPCNNLNNFNQGPNDNALHQQDYQPALARAVNNVGLRPGPLATYA